MANLTVTANWEEYTYGNQTDKALVVRWENQPYHVAFWRNYVPLWIDNETGIGFYFGWIEAAPYECLCDDDREHMEISIAEQTNEYVKICWKTDLVTFGGRIYRGNTRSIETYTFYNNGYCERDVVLWHGMYKDVKRNKDGYEVCEFAVLNPMGCASVDHLLDNNGTAVEILDPWSSDSCRISWLPSEEGSYVASGWEDKVNEWQGRIHVIKRKDGKNCPFVIDGYKSMPEGYYPTKRLVWGQTFEKCIYTFFHWPEKVDEYYLHSTNMEEVRKMNKVTHTPIMSYQFSKKCDEIQRPLRFRWLIGFEQLSENNLREKGKSWLESLT